MKQRAKRRLEARRRAANKANRGWQPYEYGRRFPSGRSVASVETILGFDPGSPDGDKAVLIEASVIGGRTIVHSFGEVIDGTTLASKEDRL